jgi:hypothetical protein
VIQQNAHAQLDERVTQQFGIVMTRDPLEQPGAAGVVRREPACEPAQRGHGLSARHAASGSGEQLRCVSSQVSTDRLYSATPARGSGALPSAPQAAQCSDVPATVAHGKRASIAK